MSIAHAQTVTATNTADSTAVTGSMSAGSSDSGYIAFLAYTSTTGVVADSVSGLGLTWTKIVDQCATDGNGGLAVFRATGSGSSGAVTGTCSDTADEICLSVHRYTGVYVGAPVPAYISYNVNGSSGSCSGGATDDDATAGFITSYDGSFLIAAFATVDQTQSLTSGFTSRVDDLDPGGGPEYQTLSVEDREIASAGSVTVGAANNLSAACSWVLVAVELRKDPAIVFAPSALSTSRTIGAPTLSMALTLSPSAISTSRTILDATVQVTSGEMAEPAIVVRVLPGATISGSVTITPDALAVSPSEPSPTVSLGAVTLSPDALEVLRSIGEPGLAIGIEFTPNAISVGTRANIAYIVGEILDVAIALSLDEVTDLSANVYGSVDMVVDVSEPTSLATSVTSSTDMQVLVEEVTAHE